MKNKLAIFTISIFSIISCAQTKTAFYSQLFRGFSPTGNPIYDTVCIYGSNTSTIYVDEVRIDGLYKLSTGDGGGGSPTVMGRWGIIKYNTLPSITGPQPTVGQAGTQHDSQSSPSSAQIMQFNGVNQIENSPGNKVGELKMAEGRFGDSMEPITLFRDNETIQPIVLHGTNEGICVNAYGRTLDNMWYFGFDFTWHETTP